MSDWRDKDDLDLTAEDITAMLEAGQPVQAASTPLPGGAVLVTPTLTLGGKTLAPNGWSGTVMTAVVTAA